MSSFDRLLTQSFKVWIVGSRDEVGEFRHKLQTRANEVKLKYGLIHWERTCKNHDQTRTCKNMQVRFSVKRFWTCTVFWLRVSQPADRRPKNPSLLNQHANLLLCREEPLPFDCQTLRMRGMSRWLNGGWHGKVNGITIDVDSNISQVLPCFCHWKISIQWWALALKGDDTGKVHIPEVPW